MSRIPFLPTDEPTEPLPHGAARSSDPRPPVPLQKRSDEGSTPPADPAPAAASPDAAASADTVELAAVTPPADPSLFAPRLAIEPEPCSSCGALLAADQRYCLSCGERRSSLRVPFPAAVATAPAPLSTPGLTPVPPAVAAPPAARRRGGLPQSALSALYGMAGAAALGIGLLAGALIVQANNDDDATPQAALTAQPTPSATPAAATPAPSAAAPAATTFTPDWAAGQNGWTVQLQTLPKDGTTPEAVATAKSDATSSGAADVGALDSDSFPSLDGGNYVIYSGVATSKQDAEAARETLVANFPDATVVEVSDTAPSSDTEGDGGSEPPPATESAEELKEKEKSQTPEDAQKNTRKAPPTVESEGTPPPADDEEAGAGSDVTEIG